MLNRFAKWSLLLVAMLTFSVVLAACGDSPTPTPASSTSQNQGQNQTAAVPAGVKSAMAGSFPDTTSVYITLNTDTTNGQIKSWQKIVEYLSTIPEVKLVFQNADVLTLAQLGTYNGDIQTWIGSEIAIGITDVNAVVALTAGGGAAPGEIPALIAAPVKDQPKADAFITKLAGSLKNLGLPEPAKETYKDATLYTFNLGIASVVAGLSKDKLFIGGGPKLVKAAFDQTADKSLANAATYKTVSGKLPTSNLGFVYADYQGIVKSLSSNPQIAPSLSSLKGSALDYTGGIGLAFATADEGFRVDAYQTYLPDKTPPAVATLLKQGANPSKILTALPENTLGLFNARDISSAYDLFISTLKTAGGTSGMSGADVDKGIADFEAATGLNVKTDIVSLFSGEFSFFVTPNAADKNFPAGGGLVADASDKAATQTKLDKITAAIEKSANGQVKFQPKTVGSTTFKTAVVEMGASKTSFNVGIAGNFAFMIIGDPATTDTVTAATGGKNFTNGAGAANFNKTKANLPNDNGGYGYVDIQAIINLATPFVPAENAAQLKGYTDKLTKLYSVGSATRQNANEASTSVFIYFPVTK